MNNHCIPAIKRTARLIFLQQVILTGLISFITVSLAAQQDSIPCNTRTPWVNGGPFTVSVDFDSPGLSCWEGDALCAGGDDDIPGNVVDANTGNFARGNIILLGSLLLSVTDATNTYSAGNFAGFAISSGLLSIGVFNTITVRTYLDNVEQEEQSVGNLAGLNSSLLSGIVDVGFITTEDFDEIEIEFEAVLQAGSYDVHYAIIERYCEGPGLDCNAQTAMNRPDFPTTIDYSNTGSDGVTVGSIDDPADAVSESTTDFASMINLAGVAGSTFLTIAEQVTDYPVGTFVGFDIENTTVVGLGLLDNLTITSYLNGVEQESISGQDLLLGAPLLQSSGRQTVGFVTATAVDAVRLTVNQTLALNVGTTRVYSAIFQEFCEGPALPCNTLTPISSPEYPVYINTENTGLTGAVCGGCVVEDPGNVIDDDPDNFAEITITAGVVTTGSISVRDALTDYPAGTFAGFHIENTGLVDLGVLDGVTITTYLDGTQQEQVSGTGLLVTAGTDLLVNTGELFAGFLTTADFDEVRISLTNVGAVNIGTTLIYGLVLNGFCEAEIVCDTTYFLNSPDFPVYVDFRLTGLEGGVCGLCEVEDPQEVITTSNTDFATITIAAGVLNTGSIAVHDALYTYPPGTVAGFVIDDINDFLQLDLFDAITITTYDNGVEQESMSGSDLIDAELIILFINPDAGVYNVGFEATLPFDEVRISVGAVAGLLTVVNVYGAFVDTQNSNDGGGLNCPDAPTAVNDTVSTNEDIAVGIEVLANDNDPDSPLGEPSIVTGPGNGMVMVNADSSITYTPDENFVGLDSFTYEICDDRTPPLCDTATVFIMVNPVTDTIMESVMEDDTLTLCADSLTTFTNPTGSISVCDGPANGSTTINGTCIDYVPDLNFNGNDTLCLVACDPNDPNLCDTTIAFIMVNPVNDAPVAENDSAAVSEDGNVDIDVLNNDSDSDSDLGIPDVIDIPTNGTASVNADSTINYAPDANFVGVDSFTYAICDDGAPALCDTATVIVVVVPVTDTVEHTIENDSTLTLCANDLTTYSDPATAIATCGDPDDGIVVITDDCAAYTPDMGFTGQDTFCLVSCDPNDPNLCDTTIVIVNVTPPNAPPIANDDLVATDLNTDINIDVLANDSDPDSPLGEPSIVDSPSNGTVTINADSTLNYDPDMGFVGVDTFSYEICDDDMPPLCDTALVIVSVGLAQDTVPCNTRTPLVLNGFNVSEAHSSPGLACWEGDFLCPGDDVPSNVIDTDTDNFATGSITGIGSLTLSVTDNSNTYTAGHFAGFAISSSLLSAGIFSSITITTYLDDVEQESQAALDLIGLSSTFLSGVIEVGFTTTEDFDEIEIEIDNLLGLGDYNVHYAVVERYCAGPALECNIETVLNKPVYPATIDYENTGSDGVSVGTVDDPEAAVSESTTDFASLVHVISVVGDVYLTVQDQVTDYPAGAFVGFDIENTTLLGIGLLDNITLTSYLDGTEQESVSGSDLLLGAPLLTSSGRQTVGFVTSTMVDAIQITVNQPVGVTLGTTRVYSAIFRMLCEGPDLPCNEFVQISTPDYPVYINTENTGITGALCAGCNVTDAGNVIDADFGNYAEIILTAGTLATGSLSVRDGLTDYPAGTFAGFHIENPVLVGTDVLTGITVTTYLDGVEQESANNTTSLVTVGSDLLVNTGEQFVGFAATEPFDEVQISLNNTVLVDLGTTRIYDVVLNGFCEVPIVCDTTYFLNTPEFPVYIDFELTGLSGGVCALCEVEDPEEVITLSNTDFATIQIDVGVLNQGSIAVRDALYTYPPGTVAGFVIEDVNDLLQADLFGSIVISTYLDGNLQEFQTGANLIDAELVVLFINPDPGVYNIGFETTLPFDEIRITVGAVASVINVVNVYGAFVDTENSDGGDLDCPEPPVAVDDSTTTPEDTPVTVDVLDNDSDPDSPLGEPTVVDDPANGTVTVNPDSTITYTPDDDFVGVDSFTYEICDDRMPPLCDTATVTITVLPVIDTVIVNIPEDSMYTTCADSLTTFTDPATGIDTCEGPDNGEVVINGTCVTYTPDPDFIGSDTFCVYVCDPNDPMLCDTTIIIIEINPVNDPPVAVDDSASTPEDTPVTVDVLDNDSDPDGELTPPTVLDDPSNGTVVVNPDSTITYTPDENFVGVDSFTYEVCDDGTPVYCDTATVTITVLPVIDTVIVNIPEDSMYTACADSLTTFNEPAESIAVCDDPANGTTGINGTCVTYTPDMDWSGIDTFCVVGCDENGICDTTIIIVIVECPTIIVNVLLEGPYDDNTGLMSTTLNEFHVLPGQDPMESSNPGAQALGIAAPPGQPYNTAPWNWPGTEGDDYGDDPGDIPYPATITDWVLVSVREGDSLAASEVWKCAGLLHNDGTVEFPEQCDCAHEIENGNDYYVVVEHRNHLPAMSTKLTMSNNNLSFDFTQNQSWIFTLMGNPIGSGQKQIGGDFVLYAGNSEQISVRVDINSSDDAQWIADNGTIFQYRAGDHNLNGDTNATDEFIWIVNNAVFTLMPF